MSNKNRMHSKNHTKPQGSSQPPVDIDPYRIWMAQEPFSVYLKLLSLYERGGIRRKDIVRSYIAMDDIGESSDLFLNGRTKNGEAATIFNRTARAIAVLSYFPGGVPFREQTYQAETFFAGIYGEQVARDHVQTSLHHCFGVGPISAEPLLALSHHVFTAESQKPLPIIPALTEEEGSPCPEHYANALIVYLAIGPFLSYWRSRTHRIWSEDAVRATALAKLSSVRKFDASGDQRNGEERVKEELTQIAALLGRQEEMVTKWVTVTRRLQTIGEHQPDKLNSLLGFALSGERMERAIFQHLLILHITAGHQNLAELEIPDHRTYGDLLSILTALVEDLSHTGIIEGTKLPPSQ